MRLFERLPRSLRLTEMGEAYLPAVRDIFEDPVRRDQRAVRRSEQASLTVRVQVAYAATWLATRLPDFCESFPYIDLKLVSAIWADALPPSEIDLKIRQGNGYWPGLVSTKLHDDTAVAIYGPQFLALHGPANHISDLVLTVDTSIAALEVVASSDYWALVPERFVRRAVRAGDVFVAQDASVPMRQDHYLLRRDDASQLSGEASAFIRWLRAQDLLDPPAPHRPVQPNHAE